MEGNSYMKKTEQGFTLSVRKVAYSTSDLKVYAALCRIG